uniref:Uncharacterized protein n=1 Tax=Glossina morsitans morsitans TaxID=37546 RepID=A0A1B0GA65_GLOMM
MFVCVGVCEKKMQHQHIRNLGFYIGFLLSSILDRSSFSV